MDKELIAEWAIEENDPRLQFLNETNETLLKIDPEAAFWWDEDPVWSMKVHDLCVEFTLTSAESYEGEGAEGFNAGWAATYDGGLIHSDCYPYNFTSEVWTTDIQDLQWRINFAIDALEYLKENYNE